MKLSNNYILNFRSIALTVCFVFCLLGSAPAQTPDNNKIWTTVGSTGTVDETDVNKVFFEGGKVQMGRVPSGGSTTVKKTKQQSAAFLPQTQSAVIRYNVTPVAGLFIPVNSPCKPGANTVPQLTVRYLATGGARVIVKLMEVDSATGAEDALLTFDSTGKGDSNNYRVESVNECGPNWRFDFKNKAYYIEATLKSGSVIANLSAAGIQMVKVEIVSLL
jgi:hypothetical protein